MVQRKAPRTSSPQFLSLLLQCWADNITSHSLSVWQTRWSANAAGGCEESVRSDRANVCIAFWQDLRTTPATTRKRHRKPAGTIATQGWGSLPSFNTRLTCIVLPCGIQPHSLQWICRWSLGITANGYGTCPKMSKDILPCTCGHWKPPGNVLKESTVVLVTLAGWTESTGDKLGLWRCY